MTREIFCPYCRKTVRAGKIRWLWFFVHLLLGTVLLYLIYCLFTNGRICPECKRRVRDEKYDRLYETIQKKSEVREQHREGDPPTRRDMVGLQSRRHQRPSDPDPGTHRRYVHIPQMYLPDEYRETARPHRGLLRGRTG